MCLVCKITNLILFIKLHFYFKMHLFRVKEIRRSGAMVFPKQQKIQKLHLKNDCENNYFQNAIN